MEVRNMGELNNALIKEVQKAMNVASKSTLKEMKKATKWFYTGGTPVMYKRTGKLGETPKATSVSVSGNTVQFSIYLDKSYRYTTGDRPSMGQVLELANYGIHWDKNGTPTVGHKGFWEKGQKDMEIEFKNVMSKYFN